MKYDDQPGGAGPGGGMRDIPDLDIVRRIQNAIDMLPSPIFIKDGAGRYIACNRAFESYIGLPRARIVGATVYDVAPAELAAIYEKADRDLIARGGTQSYETNVRYADGTFHDVLFYKSVFYNAEGKTDGISGVMLDITERKRLEKEAAQAAMKDFLTGALNLRTFYELANQEFSCFKRTGEAFSLLMLDLDFFQEDQRYIRPRGGRRCAAKIRPVCQGQSSRAGYFCQDRGR